MNNHDLLDIIKEMKRDRKRQIRKKEKSHPDSIYLYNNSQPIKTEDLQDSNYKGALLASKMPLG